MSKAGCCYLTASAHSQWWGDRQQMANARQGLQQSCSWNALGLPLVLHGNFVFLELWGFVPNPKLGMQGCWLYPLPPARLAPLRALHFLHCHHTGHRSTFPPQREAELLQLRQSPGFSLHRCCSEDVGVPVPDEIRPVAASRETLQSLPCLRGTKFH